MGLEKDYREEKDTERTTSSGERQSRGLYHTVGKIRSPAEETSKILGWQGTLFIANSTVISCAKRMKY
jgi:hypothetical protein